MALIAHHNWERLIFDEEVKCVGAEPEAEIKSSDAVTVIEEEDELAGLSHRLSSPRLRSSHGSVTCMPTPLRFEVVSTNEDEEGMEDDGANVGAEAEVGKSKQNSKKWKGKGKYEGCPRCNGAIECEGGIGEVPVTLGMVMMCKKSLDPTRL